MMHSETLTPERSERLSRYPGLRPFAPGVSGNPGAKPKYTALTKAFARALRHEVLPHMRDIANDPTAPALARAFAGAALVQAGE